MRITGWFVVMGWLLAGLPGMAQGMGSIEGVVTDSATQAPVRKAQLMLMPRGPMPAMGGMIPSARMGVMGGIAGSVSGTAVAGTGGALVATQIVPAAGITMPTKGMGAQMGMIQGGVPLQPSTVITDSSGSFAFRELAPGRYAVQAMHPRYPMRPTGPVMSEVEVKSGETARVTLSMVPGAAISGRIVDEDGDPLNGCNVQVRPAGDGNAMRPGAPGMGSDLPNELGEYRVYGIAPGKYVAYVQCRRPGFQPRPFSSGPPPPPSSGYPPQYYPQSADVSGATVLDLAGGVERSGVDFQLKPTRVFRVSGVVSGMVPAQATNSNMWVTLSRSKERFGSGSNGGRVDPATGAFEIVNVFPGNYVLTATQMMGPMGPDMSNAPMTGRQTVTVADAPVQVNVALQKPVDIPGTLVIEGDRQVTPQQIHINAMLDEPTVGLPGPRVEVQPDGSFVMKGTPAGTWRLNVYGPNVYVRAVEVGGQAMPGLVFDTTNGAAGPLRIIVSTRTGTVQGRGNPGLMYVATSDEGGDQRFARSFVGHADSEGRVQMQGLAPGKYKIYEGSVPDEEKLLQSVTVTEGAEAQVDLTKRPSGTR